MIKKELSNKLKPIPNKLRSNKKIHLDVMHFFFYSVSVVCCCIYYAEKYFYHVIFYNVDLPTP